jgi:type II secretory pathway predicted ATPase ExeA
MYEVSFGLSRRPFPSLPQPAFYCPASAIDYAYQTLLRCVERGEGVAVVVGPTGCGKSLLGQLLAEHFRQTMHVVQLASGRLDSRRALLQAILYGLGRPFRGMDEGELRLALIEYLSHGEDRRPMLLLVDEAEALPLRLLDELRMTTNLSADGEPCSRLVLLGGSTLEERLTSPKLESFSQRIAARCYLEAMNRSETKECIRVQLAAASASDDVFTAEACDAVYQATDGVPRLINQLCDHALILAFADGQTSIGRSGIEEAWADLQQLPTPWNGDSEERPSEDIIEFGGLESDDPTFESSDEGDLEDAGSVPAFRVTPAEDDLIVQSSERLDGIEESLEQLEDDFQPAGSIGTEVELVFHDPSDLLNEDFQEEEVVVDRYSRTEAEAESAPTEEPTYEIREEESPQVQADDDSARTIETPLDIQADGLSAETPDTPAIEALEEQVAEQEEADARSTESHTLDIHTDRVIPKLKHKDFARLFSNLRRTAQ